MSYALAMLLHERQRFFAAVMAVAFSIILICIQFGLLLGMFALTSIPVDNSRADIWLGSPEVLSVDIGKPIPRHYLNRLASQPEVIAAEPLVLAFEYWQRPDGGAELCIVVGSRLSENSLGAMPQLTPKLRSLLTQPQTIVVDRSELDRLGIQGVGDVVTMRGRTVRVVGLVDGLPGLQGPYVLCSLETARQLVSMSPEQTTYILGKTRSPQDTEAVVQRLRAQYPLMSVQSSGELSYRSRIHWLTMTGGGVAVGFAAVLGLLVGAVITRQSLYGATVAMIREYAVLRAMGIPRWRMVVNLGWLSFWVGAAGIMVALPLLFLFLQISIYMNLPFQMPWWLVSAAAGLTWIIAIAAGLSTLRSLQQAEPVLLLR